MPNPSLPDKLRAFRRAAALAAAIGICQGAAAPALASEEVAVKTATHGYKFYVGGVLIGKARLDTEFREGGYASAGYLKTDGVAGWFVAAEVTAKVEGAAGAAALQPRKLDVDGVTDGEAWRMTIAYEGDAPGSVTAEPPFRKKHYEIDPTQQTGALDPISAVVQALAPSTRSLAQACNRTLPIFDGRKRYDVVLGRQIDEGTSKDGFPMVECEGRWTRVGGFKEKHMRRPDIPFTARFELRDGLTVPSKVWGDTEFGGAVAVLRN